MMDIVKSIKQAYFEQCQKNGLTNIKVTNLTKSAYISRGTFYLHYENIDELTNEIEQELLNRLWKVASSFPYQSDMKKYDWFLKVLSSEVEQIKADYNWYELFLGPKGDPNFLEKLTQYIHSSSEWKYDALNLKKDAKFLEYVNQGSLGIFLCWINNEAQMSKEELSSLMMVHLREMRIE